MLKRSFLLSSILSLFLLFFATAPISAAPQTCVVHVTDQSDQALSGVDVKVFNGGVTNQLAYENNTDSGGNIQFQTNGFGAGAGANNTLTFHKDGYNDVTKAWSDSNQFSCPPTINQTLISSSTPVTQVYICTTGNQCTTAVDPATVPSGTTSYTDQSTCQASCILPGSKWNVRGTPPNQDCIPDPNGPYDSKLACQQANNIGVGTTIAGFDYIQTTNECRPNSNASCTPNNSNNTCLSLDRCNAIVSANYDCTKNNNCATSAGQTCNGGSGISTALGCIPTEPSALIGALINFSIGIAGGIALLLMAFGAIGMITSAGNEEAKKAAQQRFTGAIQGLLFVIFATLLLKIIGVDILKLPGFLP